VLVALHERTKSCEVIQAVSRERIQYGMKTGIKEKREKLFISFKGQIHVMRQEIPVSGVCVTTWDLRVTVLVNICYMGLQCEGTASDMTLDFIFPGTKITYSVHFPVFVQN
jgi:hypothetical protein